MTKKVFFNATWGHHVTGDVAGLPDAVAVQLAATPAPVNNLPPASGAPNGFIVTILGTSADVVQTPNNQTPDQVFTKVGTQHQFKATLDPS